ncbi:MAG: DciA family protein [Anaeromyxobacter sp.]
MRGRRRTVASVLAETLAKRPAAGEAALAAAFAEACGPRLAREVSFRGVLKDGRLLIVASTREWAEQLASAERMVCERVNARLGREAAAGLEVKTA